MPMIARVGRPGLLGLAARTAVVAGTATAVSSGVAARHQRRAAYHAAQLGVQATPAAAAPPVQPEQDATVAKLHQLAALHAQGVLSNAEFAAAKAQVLGL
ncbi:MAG: SHOCT domain-containing protein [Cellulomonas sp.]|nr:SHOCT domain-containing protein [Cellulomonas sp.]